LTPGCAHDERLTFPAELRLRRKLDFEAAYARGRRFGNAYFGIIVRPNGLDHPRLGLSVATRITRTSVERNRIRRVVRESFRLAQHALAPVDLVVSARARAKGAPAADLRAALQDLWEKVRLQCAPSSGS
jgi:ribonuclease P protein component